MAKKRGNILLIAFLTIVIILPYLGALYLRHWYGDKVKEVERAAFIVISKEDMMLRLFDYAGQTLLEFPIACGQGFGDKQKIGDMRTPEGIFHVSTIENASSWKHDFKDGNGEIEGAYGPYFIRLDVPGHKGIGIHGTHDPQSIGGRATEGCIRLNNNDLLSLKERVYVGMVVVITGSAQDLIALAKEKEKKDNALTTSKGKDSINKKQRTDTITALKPNTSKD